MATKMIDRTDRSNGTTTRITLEAFAAVLSHREDPRFAEEIYSNVVCGGGSYRTPGFDYRPSK